MCKECGKVVDVEKVNCPCERRDKIAGNKIEEVHLYLKGVCKKCLKSPSTPPRQSSGSLRARRKA